MRFDESVWIDAEPETVWSHLTDLERAPEFVPFLEEVHLEGDAPVDVGRQADFIMAFKGQRAQTSATVNAFDPARHLALRAEVPEIRSAVDVTWHLDAKDGGTQVRQSVEIEFGSMMARLGAKAFLGDQLSAATVQRALNNLKAEVEPA